MTGQPERTSQTAGNAFFTTDRYSILRELERHSQPFAAHARPRPERVAVVGRGRAGTALAGALSRSGMTVDGPLGRGAGADRAHAVLLCVPDGEIAAAAAAVTPGPVVGHCSGATSLEVLAPHPAFSLHPLMTFADGQAPRLEGAGAAIAGDAEDTLAVARALAETLGLRPITIADDDRAAYHAAASIASNFLVTLEEAAERVAATAGLDRSMLAPLVRATIDNWERLGSERALTGPVARGDEETVRRQRKAIADRAPQLVELFDALVAATRTLAAGRRPVGA